MKVSVSLPAEDVAFLDRYAEEHGEVSRSAVLHWAVRMLRTTQLGDAYADAWQEWEESGDEDVWAPTVGDGLRD